MRDKLCINCIKKCKNTEFRGIEMMQGDVYLNCLLENYRKQLKSQKQELKTLPPGSLSFARKDNVRIFIHLIPGTTKTNGKPSRKGITKRPDLIGKLARKKYLEKSIEILTEETGRLEKFLQRYTEPTASYILGMLPDSYRTLPKEMFFPKRAAEHRWAERPYQQNTKNLHEKKHITSRGLRVRSKSELLIAEKLYEYDVPFRYDALVDNVLHTLSPDFMFLIDGCAWYWEHCGMMGDPAYRAHNEWKLAAYQEMGIFPWKNLIVTYDTEDGIMDMRVIDAEIKNKLLPLSAK